MAAKVRLTSAEGGTLGRNTPFPGACTHLHQHCPAPVLLWASSKPCKHPAPLPILIIHDGRTLYFHTPDCPLYPYQAGRVPGGRRQQRPTLRHPLRCVCKHVRTNVLSLPLPASNFSAEVGLLISSLFYSEHQNACSALHRSSAHTVAVRAHFFAQTR